MTRKVNTGINKYDLIPDNFKGLDVNALRFLYKKAKTEYKFFRNKLDELADIILNKKGGGKRGSKNRLHNDPVEIQQE